MNPCAGVLARFGEGQSCSAKACELIGLEQVDNAQREKGIAIVSVFFDRRVVHGENVHGLGVPRPHGQRIRIEQEAISPLIVGQCGVAPLDRIRHLIERECQLSDFIARSHRRTVTAHPGSQRVRVVDERFDGTHDERPRRVGEAQRQCQ